MSRRWRFVSPVSWPSTGRAFLNLVEDSASDIVEVAALCYRGLAISQERCARQRALVRRLNRFFVWCVTVRPVLAQAQTSAPAMRSRCFPPLHSARCQQPRWIKVSLRECRHERETSRCQALPSRTANKGDIVFRLIGRKACTIHARRRPHQWRQSDAHHRPPHGPHCRARGRCTCGRNVPP